MGNSAQDHRLRIGTFSARMMSSTWLPSSGFEKLRRRKKAPDIDKATVSYFPTLALLLVILVNIAVLQFLVPRPVAYLSDFLTHVQCAQRGTDSSAEGSGCERTAGQVRQLLLLLSGDVERNPGPFEPDTLVSGLADLVGNLVT